jgi:hypothetical protein
MSRKPLRRESRSASAYLYDLRACFLLLHARLRVRRTPGIPCALDYPRDNDDASLGRIASRECMFTPFLGIAAVPRLIHSLREFVVTRLSYSKTRQGHGRTGRQ